MIDLIELLFRLMQLLVLIYGIPNLILGIINTIKQLKRKKYSKAFGDIWLILFLLVIFLCILVGIEILIRGLDLI